MTEPPGRQSGRRRVMLASWPPPSMAMLLFWGLWLRVAAADLVQWVARRKGVPCLFPDTVYYWALAGKIRAGAPYELTDFEALPHFALRTPGYPLFLAACQFAFGPRLLPVRLVQAALGAGCVWLLAALVRRSTPAAAAAWTRGRGWTAATAAAAWSAVDPYVVANAAVVLSEAVFLPLMLLAQCGFAALWPAAGGAAPRGLRRTLLALGTGAASGMAVLVRPSWSPFVPAALAVWLAVEWRDRGRRSAAARGAILVALGAALVMAPWWARNARVYGRFVPTALWTGASLYDGLNPRAAGDSEMSFLSDPEFWPLGEEAQDDALRARALAFARDHPVAALRLAAVKAARFWSPWPNAAAFRRPALAALSALFTIPQFALIALGCWDRRRDPRALALLGLPLAYTSALHLIFVGSMRYRVPAAVPALGLAALGLRALLNRRTPPGPIPQDRPNGDDDRGGPSRLGPAARAC